MFERRKRGGVNGFIFGKIDVLLKQSEFQRVYFDNIARISRFFARDYLENRRFSRAVATDQTEITFRKLEIKKAKVKIFTFAFQIN